MAKEYIEREAALEVANGWREQLIPTYGENDEYVKCLGEVAEHLDIIPAADVRPVVRGRWEWDSDNGYYYCSNCNAVSPREDQEGEYCDTPAFCHVCGADMREVQNDN